MILFVGSVKSHPFVAAMLTDYVGVGGSNCSGLDQSSRVVGKIPPLALIRALWRRGSLAMVGFEHRDG